MNYKYKLLGKNGIKNHRALAVCNKINYEVNCYLVNLGAREVSIHCAAEAGTRLLCQGEQSFLQELSDVREYISSSNSFHT